MKYKLTITILRLVALLPLPVLYAFNSMLWPVLYYVVRYRRKVTRQNLLRSFPDKSLSDIKHIEHRFYRHLCDIAAETIKMLHISDRQMQRRVTVTGMHFMEQAAAQGHPVFLFIGHYGNWEWVQEVTKRIKAPTVHGEIYDPLASEVFDRVMKTIRSRYPTVLIAKKQAPRTILRMKRDNDSYLIGFIADQRPSRHSLHHWTTFLQQDTPYMVGAEELGRHVDAAYFYLHVEQPRRGYYTMDIEELQQPEEQEEFPYTIAYMRALEKDIRRAPELWLWTHKRWKHKRPAQ